MASTAPSPQLAPPNENVPASQGGAKKKNKKKKSAAAKANAAAAAAAAATSTASKEPMTPIEASSEPDARNGPDNDDSEAPDEAPDSAPVKGKPATDVSEQPASPKKATATNGNGYARQPSTTNGHAIIPTKDEPDDTSNDGDDSEEVPAKADEDNTSTEETRLPIRSRNNGDNVMSAQDDHQTEELRVEIDKLRKQVEELQKEQESHKEEAEQLRNDLEESEAGREQAETQYENLLGRVEKIKETLGDRLKRDKQELEEAKDRIDELEAQNETLLQGGGAAEAAAATAEAEIQRLRAELNEAEREQNAIRGRTQLSQQNWVREKEDLTRQLHQLKSELESTSGAMGEWEVIAMEERSVRENLSEKAADLEEQLATAREQLERVAEERDEQSRAVDSLQRALQEIQEARKRELREMVESTEAQIETAKKQAQEAETAAEKATTEAEGLRRELERTSPFEKEVKEKNLLIGKLRHESIVLNDHLTKALRYIKKNKPEENVDRQVVTNHLLQFLALDRSDPKKFQILQVIAGVLNWTEEQKEKAGLARPGTSNNTLRLPSSPFHRTPSTPSLNTDFFTEPTSTASRESLADLWAGFLERSVEEAASESSGPPSRKSSLPKG